MSIMRLFDMLFVDQLFHAPRAGKIVFYPNGRAARGYLLAADQEARVRSGVRRLTMATLFSVFLIIALVRFVEGWFGFTIPLPWFIGGAALVIVVFFVVILRRLARLTVGLAPAEASD